MHRITSHGSGKVVDSRKFLDQRWRPAALAPGSVRPCRRRTQASPPESLSRRPNCVASSASPVTRAGAGMGATDQNSVPSGPRFVALFLSISFVKTELLMTGTSNWHSLGSGAMSPAGRWFTLVSTPIFRFFPVAVVLEDVPLDFVPLERL